MAEGLTKETLKVLQDFDACYSNAETLFMTWEEVREPTISDLRKMATKIQARVNAHRATQIGTSTLGAGTTLVTLAAAFGAPLTGGISLGVAAAVGAAVSVTSGAVGLVESWNNDDFVEESCQKVGDLLQDYIKKRVAFMSKMEHLAGIFNKLSGIFHGDWSGLSVATSLLQHAKALHVLTKTKDIERVFSIFKMGKLAQKVAPKALQQTIGGVTRITSKIMTPLAVVSFAADIADISINAVAYYNDQPCDQTADLFQRVEKLDDEFEIFRTIFP